MEHVEEGDPEKGWMRNSFHSPGGCLCSSCPIQPIMKPHFSGFHSEGVDFYRSHLFLLYHWYWIGGLARTHNQVILWIICLQERPFLWGGGETGLPANFSGQRTDCRADAICLQTPILFSFLLVFAGHMGKFNTRMTEPHVKVTGVPSWCHRTQLPTITPLLDSGPQEPSRLSLYESFEKTGTLIMHHLYPIKNVYRNWVYFCKLIFVPLICVFMPVHVKKFLNLWWLYFIYI